MLVRWVFCVLMGDLSKRVDIQKLISLGDDLIDVLNNKKDGDSLTQSLESTKMLRSLWQEDAHEVQISLEDYQKKISTTKENIDNTRRETVGDAEIEHLQNELEGKLQMEGLLHQELSTTVSDELNDLERQRTSIEERKELVKKIERDLLRAQNLLSMCASVTRIIPNLDDKTSISGLIVDRSKKKAEKFELEASLSPIEACNRLWMMADCD